MANYTILLIDYEPRSIERFRDPLVGAGYTVEIATDGISGIEAFHRLNPDMVLVEAMIPKKHGFEVCQELKRTPHGRRTPVLITTGVYKGRKYRTQALHIYGCDEYIEKPIAAEQLLEVVGKFFPHGTPGAVEAPKDRKATSEPSGDASPRGPGITEAAATTESSHPKVDRRKSSPVPKSSAADDTEDEIMARLDAILPDWGGTPQVIEPATVAMLATIAPPEELVIADFDITQDGDDPFAQMRAELDAELGAFSEASAVEPAPESLAEFPSDQKETPSILEALPVPDLADGAGESVETISVEPMAPVESMEPALSIEKPGQVVTFDTKRSRKNKKSGKANKERSQQTASTAPATVSTTPPPAKPVTTTSAPAAQARTVVSSESVAPAPRRGVPAWLWAVAVIVAIASTYFILSRVGASPPDAVPVAVAPPLSQGIESDTAGPVKQEPAPPPVEPAPVASAPAPSAPPAPPSEPPKIAAEVKKPALKPTKGLAPKKTPAVVTAGVPPPVPAPRNEPKAIERARPAPPEAPARVDADDSVTGLEAVVNPAETVPPAGTVPAELVAIDEADVLPVSLQRKPPTYSLQAREMHIAGMVVMNVLVNEHGTVDQVVLVSGVQGADINDSAMRAAKAWTYQPATKRGIPVKVWTSERVVFKP